MQDAKIHICSNKGFGISLQTPYTVYITNFQVLSELV